MTDVSAFEKASKRPSCCGPKSKFASTPSPAVLIAFVLLAELPRSRAFVALDPPVFILGEAADALLQDTPFWHSCEHGWAGMPCNSTTIHDQSADAKSNFKSSRALGELIGVLLTTMIFISREVSWRKRSTIGKVEDASAGPESHCCSMQETHHKDTRHSVATQAELDWVAAARSGRTRLTEDVYKAAMQWLIGLPLADIVDRMAPEDRRLVKPVIDLLHRGQEEKALVLMEQVGSLDQMQRALQRSRAMLWHDDGSGASPLSRSLSPLSRSLRNQRDQETSAACLRHAIENYAMPPTEDTSPVQKSPFGYMSWKHSPITIGARSVTRAAKLKSPRNCYAHAQHPLPQDGCFWVHDTDSGCGA